MEPTVLYDLETDGLLDTLTTVHCVALQEDGGEIELLDREGLTRKALVSRMLHKTCVAHNAIGFDEVVLRRLFHINKDPVYSLDSCVMSRLAWPDLEARDYANMRKRPRPYTLPRRLSNDTIAVGSHSLEAWGYRTHEHKGSFQGSWETYVPEMGSYCKQDVKTLGALWSLLHGANLDPRSVQLEHAFARVLLKQMARGVGFDAEAAEVLETKLTIRLAEIDDALRSSVLPFTDISYTKVKKLKRVREVAFSGSSRAHIARHFRERYGWEPTVRTEPTKTHPNGQPKLDAEILEDLPYPEAPLLAERAKIAKVLGYVSTGKNSWLKFVQPDGRIYGYINHMGTVTSRCSHSRPNLGNIPKVGELGAMCRSLFIPSKGMVMVGADASGLELRCLANRLYPFDGGAYAKIILEGDIHSANQKAAGLATRDQAKTFIYAWLYGAGAAKLGNIVGGGEAEGRSIKAKFLKATPGVVEWLESVKSQATSHGYVVALDGRKVPIPTGKNPRDGSTELLDYVAPNYQLQADGAVVMKQATVLADAAVAYKHLNAWQVLSVHDETQYESSPEDAAKVATEMVQGIRDAGEELGMMVKLDGESKIGGSWRETH